MFYDISENFQDKVKKNMLIFLYNYNSSLRQQQHRWFVTFSIFSFKMRLMEKRTVQRSVEDDVVFVKPVNNLTVESAEHVGT